MKSAIPEAFPPPPACAQRMASDDPDEVSGWVARFDGYHSRVVHGTGPYGFRLASIQTPSLRVAWGSTRLANTLRARFLTPTFHVPLHGVQRYVHGRREFKATTGSLVFVAARTEVTRHSHGGPLLAVDLDVDAFEAEVRRRQGGEGVEQPQTPRMFDPTGMQSSALIEAIGALVRAHEPGGTAAGRLHAESRVLAALAGTLTASSAGRAAPVSAGSLRRVEDWIDAHLSEVITLGRLCEVARVGERSLQLAFQARHSMSPMRFVCERRLAEAQRRLSRCRPDEDVTAIATSLGFTHLGRFSNAYRAVFGEAPSRTLERGRPRMRAPTSQGDGGR